MTVSIKTLAVIREEILRDYRSLIPDAVIKSDSEIYAKASAVASALDGVYSYLLWQKKQMFADTADSDMLDRHAAQRGLTRKPASRASGSVTVTGTAGTVLASGVALTDDAGLAFVVTADSEIGAGGTAVAAIRAVATGVASNLVAGTALNLSGAASGIDASATVISLAGGGPVESDVDLLARLLDVIRNPPAGGNKHDYKKWALEVAGVANAYVYPLRRGIGTVDVVITAAGGLPSAELITTVQTYIDARRPTGMRGFAAIPPVLRLVPVTVRATLVYGAVWDTVQAAIQNVITNYFCRAGSG